MTVLKWANSRCASNSSAVSGGRRFSSRAPVSSVGIGSSAMGDTSFHFASQLLVSNSAARRSASLLCKTVPHPQRTGVIPNGCSSKYRNRWNGSTLM
jgi:hypothetical protein